MTTKKEQMQELFLIFEGYECSKMTTYEIFCCNDRGGRGAFVTKHFIFVCFPGQTGRSCFDLDDVVFGGQLRSRDYLIK